MTLGFKGGHIPMEKPNGNGDKRAIPFGCFASATGPGRHRRLINALPGQLRIVGRPPGCRMDVPSYFFQRSVATPSVTECNHVFGDERTGSPLDVDYEEHGSSGLEFTISAKSMGAVVRGSNKLGLRG